MAGYTIVRAADVEDVYAGSDVPGEFHPLSDALQSEQLAVTLIRVPAHSDFEQGTGHFHEEIEEIYIVTRGTLSMRFGDDVLEVGAGSVVRVAPRTPRSHRNEGAEAVEMWAVSRRTDRMDATKIDDFWEASAQAAQRRSPEPKTFQRLGAPLPVDVQRRLSPRAALRGTPRVGFSAPAARALRGAHLGVAEAQSQVPDVDDVLVVADAGDGRAARRVDRHGLGQAGELRHALERRGFGRDDQRERAASLLQVFGGGNQQLRHGRIHERALGQVDEDVELRPGVGDRIAQRLPAAEVVLPPHGDDRDAEPVERHFHARRGQIAGRSCVPLDVLLCHVTPFIERGPGGDSCCAEPRCDSRGSEGRRAHRSYSGTDFARFSRPAAAALPGDPRQESAGA